MRASRLGSVLITPPTQRLALAAGLAAGVVLILALLAPAAGVLALAALAAAAMVGAEQHPIRPRLDRLALAGLAAAALAAAFAGVAGLMGALFSWFLIDSARDAARRAAAPGQRPLERAPVWLAAALVILVVAAAAPHVILGLPLDLPHPPGAVVWIAGLIYALALADAAVRVLARWRLGEGGLSPVASEASFHAVLLAGFVLCPDVSAGLAALIAYRLAYAIRAWPSLRRPVSA